MPTCIHLYSEDSDRAVFNHVFSSNTVINEGDEFIFSYSLYASMPENFKKTFDKLKLKIGKYIVESTYKGDSEIDKNITYIFLKPKEESEENEDKKSE